MVPHTGATGKFTLQNFLAEHCLTSKQAVLTGTMPTRPFKMKNANSKFDIIYRAILQISIL